MTAFFSIFLFFVFIALVMMLFSGWVVFNIIRLMFGGIARVFGGGNNSGAETTISTPTTRCLRPVCRARNPVTARFCRRCGAQLPSPQRVDVRRAAVW